MLRFSNWCLWLPPTQTTFVINLKRSASTFTNEHPGRPMQTAEAGHIYRKLVFGESEPGC
ncbi:MAG: hypothetical protein ACLQFI_06745 [Methylocella sp.]